MAPPPDLKTPSLADRLAKLNIAQSASSTNASSSAAPRIPSGSGSSLRDKIAKYEVKGANPLVPKGSFGLSAGTGSTGLGGSRELIGNRIPSAGRGGFGVTPNGVQPSKTSYTPKGVSILNSSSSSGQEALSSGRSSSSIGDNYSHVSRSSSGTSSPVPEAESVVPAPLSSSTPSLAAVLKSEPESELDSIVPPAIDPPMITTNSLPQSYLASTDSDYVSENGPGSLSRSASIIAQPSSTTSLSSLASGFSAVHSVASSYMTDLQGAPPDIQTPKISSPVSSAGELDVKTSSQGSMIGEEDDKGLMLNIRSSSPVGSMIVDITDSVAPSMVGDDEDIDNRDDAFSVSPVERSREHALFSESPDQPSTPKASNTPDVTLNELPELTSTGSPIRAKEVPSISVTSHQLTAQPPISSSDPLKSIVQEIHLEPEEEPEIENADEVPVLEAQEHAHEREHDISEDKLLEISATEQPEERVGQWAEEVSEVERVEKQDAPVPKMEIMLENETEVEDKETPNIDNSTTTLPSALEDETLVDEPSAEHLALTEEKVNLSKIESSAEKDNLSSEIVTLDLAQSSSEDTKAQVLTAEEDEEEEADKTVETVARDDVKLRDEPEETDSIDANDDPSLLPSSEKLIDPQASETNEVDSNLNGLGIKRLSIESGSTTQSSSPTDLSSISDFPPVPTTISTSSTIDLPSYQTPSISPAGSTVISPTFSSPQTTQSSSTPLPSRPFARSPVPFTTSELHQRSVSNSNPHSTSSSASTSPMKIRGSTSPKLGTARSTSLNLGRSYAWGSTSSIARHRSKSPFEIDSDDEESAGGPRVVALSRERYS